MEESDREILRQASRTDTGLFSRTLIHQAIELDTQEPISSEQLLAFAQVLEEELEKLNQDIEETPVKGKDERKTQRRKLKKVLRKVKDDFSVRTEKYENYQEIFQGPNSFLKIFNYLCSF